MTVACAYPGATTIAKALGIHIGCWRPAFVHIGGTRWSLGGRQ
jgi:hypothetical protein